MFEDASGTLQPTERKWHNCVRQIQKKIFYFLLFRDCFNLVEYKLNIKEKKKILLIIIYLASVFADQTKW